MALGVKFVFGLLQIELLEKLRIQNVFTYFLLKLRFVKVVTTFLEMAKRFLFCSDYYWRTSIKHYIP